jgi:hypothetical protein
LRIGANRPGTDSPVIEDIEIVGKIAREAFRVACLHREIKLALERAAQLAYDLNRPVATHFGYLVLDEMGNVLDDSEISVDLRLDSGAANF